MSDFLAEIATEAEDADELARGRAAFLDALDEAQPAAAPAPRRRWPLAAGLLAAVALGALVLAPPSAPTAVHEAQPVDEGRYVRASDGPATVTFSDGTVLTVLEGGARVTRISASRIEVVLEEGALTVEPTGPSPAWFLKAGNYAVEVEGDVHARWRDGELVVTPLAELAEEAPATEAALAVKGPVPTSTTAVPLGFAPPEAAPTAEPAPVEARVEARPSRARESAPGWRSLAQAGRFADSWQLLEEEGMPSDPSAADGLLLADVARLSGHPADAQPVLTQLRTLHPGTPQAAQAAFLLGRLATESGQDDPAVHFQAYLDEHPDGPLAEHALGRLVSVLAGRGDAQAAEKARAYLERFPEGAHAEIAREVLR